MTLASDLQDLANQAPTEIPSITHIEDQAAHRRNLNRAINASALLAIVVVGMLAAPRALDLFERGGAAPDERPVAPVSDPAPATDPTPTPWGSPCPLSLDACGENEGLPQAEEWLGSILDGAGIRFRNNYRSDGGGGHTTRGAGLMISVLRPTEAVERAARRIEVERLWSDGGTVVYGSQFGPVADDSLGEDISGAYFFWRAGGVDSWASKNWVGSGPRPEEVRPLIAKIIREQERNPYPYGSDG